MDFIEFGQVEGIDLLQKLPVFSQLSFDETGRLGQIATIETHPAEAVIIRRDALGEALYIVVEGEVVVSCGGRGEPADDELGRLGVGEIFGEMSLIDDLLTSARVTTSQESKLLKIPRAAFQRLLEEDKGLALKIYRSFCRTLSERLRKINQHLSAKDAFAVGVR